jgi:hypothetical protein
MKWDTDEERLVVYKTSDANLGKTSSADLGDDVDLIGGPCYLPKNDVFVLPPDPNCRAENMTTKVSGYITLKSQLAPIRTLPIVNELTVSDTTTGSIDLVVNVSIAAPGASFVCGAVESDTTVSDPTFIKSLSNGKFTTFDLETDRTDNEHEDREVIDNWRSGYGF